MTVKELKKMIAKLPDDMPVIMQKQSDSDIYSPLAGVSNEYVYVAYDEGNGDAFEINSGAIDNFFTNKEWLNIKKNNKALILMPKS